MTLESTPATVPGDLLSYSTRRCSRCGTGMQASSHTGRRRWTCIGCGRSRA